MRVRKAVVAANASAQSMPQPMPRFIRSRCDEPCSTLSELLFQQPHADDWLSSGRDWAAGCWIAAGTFRTVTPEAIVANRATSGAVLSVPKQCWRLHWQSLLRRMVRIPPP
eukprot:TRINITY_DN4396_c0_g1_i7.p5 TRINITY_DN4396_c0_g1~~TRINITY_DN4396_c0_g1_i7.p5  ORF type:complete len:111 (-),score=8.43 TRINITY_DN4396_c0_g1_i7:112-444(-)